jgi:hypothetical protein
VTIATVKRNRRAGWVGGFKGGANARIRPAQIAADRTLVIAAVRSQGHVQLVRGRAVRGAIPGCLPPVALMQGVVRGGKPHVLSCRVGPLPTKHRIVVSPGTNTTATNETTSTGPASGSTTAPAPKTTPMTATVPTTATTVTSTATGSGTTTGSQTTRSSVPGGPQGVKAPPILQACMAAARHAQVDQRARSSAGATR